MQLWKSSLIRLTRQSPCHALRGIHRKLKTGSIINIGRPPTHFWLSGVGTVVTLISRDRSLGAQVVASPTHVTTISNIAKKKIKNSRPLIKWSPDSNWSSVLSRITPISSFSNLLFILILWEKRLLDAYFWELTFYLRI